MRTYMPSRSALCVLLSGLLLVCAGELAAQHASLVSCGFAPADQYRDLEQLKGDNTAKYVYAEDTAVTLESLSQLTQLRGLWLRNCGVDWGGLIEWKGLQGLEEFGLQVTESLLPLTPSNTAHPEARNNADAAALCVCRMKNLKRLHLDTTPFAYGDEDDHEVERAGDVPGIDRAIAQAEQLEALFCTPLPQNPELVRQIATRSKLRHLVLPGRNVSTAALTLLCAHCELETVECTPASCDSEPSIVDIMLALAREPAIRHLSLRGVPVVTDTYLPVTTDFLAALSKSGVQSLYLGGAEFTGEEALEHLKTLSNLRRFGVTQCIGLTPDALRGVLSLPLEELALGGGLYDDQVSLASIGDCRTLHTLDLSTFERAPKTVFAIASRIEGLRKLHLPSGLQLDEVGLSHLVKLKALRELTWGSIHDAERRSIAHPFRAGPHMELPVGENPWEKLRAFMIGFAGGQIESLHLAGSISGKQLADLLADLPSVRVVDVRCATVSLDDSAFSMPKRELAYLGIRCSAEADVSCFSKLRNVRNASLAMQGMSPLEGSEVDYGPSPAIRRLNVSGRVRPETLRAALKCPSLKTVQCGGIWGLDDSEADEWFGTLRRDFKSVNIG